MELVDILRRAVELGGSDIFVVPGSSVMVKVDNNMVPLTQEKLLPKDTEALVGCMYEIARRDYNLLERDGDDDFSFAILDVSRFRCNAYKQRGTVAAICRIVNFELPNASELQIPSLVMELSKLRSGMVLVTGPAGSGKSTTLACIVDKINAERQAHIVTIEDPIEYLHRHNKSLVSQREVPNDAATFSRALRAALRQAPDVIMLGEMRDLDTIRTAITAAETGHLLLSSLHTIGAAKTVDRVIDTFPAEQQAQIRVQLSMVLKAVVSQRLIPTIDGHRVAVFEVMTVNPAIQNMIRDGRTHQIDNVIFGGSDKSMISMDAELQKMVREGKITRENALLYAANPDTLSKRI
ncbi:MAG: PilT/PilU family type 4a pilus ATPase [Oscillospiraceae bacterium]|nr:PilT/PilU family type 4a pilus ATPase [Oscillospiraceae bacterium]MBR0392871.1 PilT/PilU family type 4a pilus ATPase [Oscillospiraceae bacterium]